MVVKEKYPKAMVIYPLIRRKKLNKMEAMIDFLTEPGVLEMVDSLNDMIEKNIFIKLNYTL